MTPPISASAAAVSAPVLGNLSLDQFHPAIQHLFQEQKPMLLLLQAMKNGVVIFDKNGHVLLFNPAMGQLRQLSDTHLNRPCDEVIPSPELKEAVTQVVSTGQSVSQELKLLHDNLKQHFQINLVPLPLASAPNGDEELGCVAIFHDITAIKRTDKIRRDFVANVSHELRTPLSAINGYAETLLDGALDDPGVAKEFIEVIFRHSQRLSQLVTDLLDLSKLESPDFSPDLIPVDLRALVHKVHSMSEGHTQGKQLVFFMHIPDDLPKVLANVINLEQVLTNLVDNAVKYTPTGGKIAVSAFINEQGMVQVNVKDTGMGISRKHIPRLFERFYRVDKARSRDMGGTGLGLSIVKHIVQLHGGDIWVESEPEVGSTFSFTLRPAE